MSRMIGLYSNDSKEAEQLVRAAIKKGFRQPILYTAVNGHSRFVSQFEIAETDSLEAAREDFIGRHGEDAYFAVWQEGLHKLQGTNGKKPAEKQPPPQQPQRGKNHTEFVHQDKMGTYTRDTLERAAPKPLDLNKPKFTFPDFRHRNQLGTYLNQLGLTREFAEVGVYQCDFSQQIMRQWKGEQLHLIDRKFDRRQDVPRSKFYEMDSLDASHEFEDGQLDGVYIDADHSLKGVTQDLEVWWHKVRPGGLFCGHDYLNSYDMDTPGAVPVPLPYWPRNEHGLNYGVKMAVRRFADARGLKIHETESPDEGRSPSWFIVKPYRFVTTLTEDFVPGLVGLIQSIKENGEIDFCFTVVEYSPISQKTKDFVNALGIHIDWIPRQVLGWFEFDRDSTDSPRMAENLNKFLVWKLPYRETMCYTDVDVICLSSLRGLGQLKPLSVTMMQSAIGRDPDYLTQYRPSGMYPFNAGWFVFEASHQIYDECQEYARTYRNERIAFGDQVPMNDYWAEKRPDQINHVDMNWNISHWCLHHPYYQLNWDHVKLLHFAHKPKPWRDRPEADWMKPGWDLFKDFYQRGARCATEKLRSLKG